MSLLSRRRPPPRRRCGCASRAETFPAVSSARLCFAADKETGVPAQQGGLHGCGRAASRQRRQVEARRMLRLRVPRECGARRGNRGTSRTPRRVPPLGGSQGLFAHSSVQGGSAHHGPRQPRCLHQLGRWACQVVLGLQRKWTEVLWGPRWPPCPGRSFRKGMCFLARGWEGSSRVPGGCPVWE